MPGLVRIRQRAARARTCCPALVRGDGITSLLPLAADADSRFSDSAGQLDEAVGERGLFSERAWVAWARETLASIDPLGSGADGVLHGYAKSIPISNPL